MKQREDGKWDPGPRIEDQRPGESVPPVDARSELRALVAEGHPVKLEALDSVAKILLFSGEVVFVYRAGFRVGGALLERFDRGR